MHHSTVDTEGSRAVQMYNAPSKVLVQTNKSIATRASPVVITKANVRVFYFKWIWSNIIVQSVISRLACARVNQFLERWFVNNLCILVSISASLTAHWLCATVRDIIFRPYGHVTWPLPEQQQRHGVKAVVQLQGRQSPPKPPGRQSYSQTISWRDSWPYSQASG